MKAKEYDKLTDEEIKVIISKLNGYLFRPHGGTGVMYWRKSRNTPCWTEGLADLPDYLNDLNIMHEVEKVIPYYLEGEYQHKLYASVHDTEVRQATTPMGFEYVRATAEQRAKAFVLTMTADHGDNS